jgi:ATP-dependent helicase/nuclease subunit B
MILGLLEARLLSFDRVLLAGLDETIWPPAVETDAFLNRPMRAALGLSAPERRIGQTAHDFVSGLGAPEVILSRSKKRGGEPTVASRFLQRIAAAAGASGEALKRAEARGRRFLELARVLDRPDEFRSAPRPAPRPPAARRPRALSVTRIETLRRDPYSIYAEYILNLKALEPVGRPFGPRQTGQAWHVTLQDFLEKYPAGPLPAEARCVLTSIAEARFAPLRDDQAFAALNWPNVENSLDFFFEFERKSRLDAVSSFAERRGEIEIPLANADRFTLRARADRIDCLSGGRGRIIDYKSGAPPSAKEVTVGFAPQLTLEAEMLRQGGFEGISPLEPSEALYLKLGGPDGGFERPAGGDKGDIRELAARHFAELKVLLEQFSCAATPYLSRPFPKFAGRFAVYDHLARVKEWSTVIGESESGDAP